MNFGPDAITYNRESKAFKRTQEVLKEGGVNVNRFAYAYGAVKINEVMRWKVDTGGGKVEEFEPYIKRAIAETLAFNAEMNGGAKVDIRDLSRFIIPKVSHMSLFGFIDAMESLIAGEDPCAVEMYGFKAEPILKACNQYWARAKREYEAMEQSKRHGEYLDVSYEKAVPMPETVKEAIKALEEKHGVVQDTDDGRAAMRAAAERWKKEHGTLEF